MEKTREIVKNICILSKSEKHGIHKEVNIVRECGALFFHLGTWTADNRKCLNEFMLTERELRMLLRSLEKEKLLETENEKFQKDYIQQIHNGPANDEKEILR